jgi:hypothetical protein
MANMFWRQRNRTFPARLAHDGQGIEVWHAFVAAEWLDG